MAQRNCVPGRSQTHLMQSHYSVQGDPGKRPDKLGGTGVFLESIENLKQIFQAQVNRKKGYEPALFITIRSESI